MEFPTGRLSLYLMEIGEPRANSLRVVVQEANGLGPFEATPVGEARRIVPDHTSRTLEIVWKSYVAYAIRDEVYARLEDGEIQADSSLHTRTDSAFLNYVATSTWATNDHPGPLVHWVLDTLNHCLDVVGVEAPRVGTLETPELWREPTTYNNWSKR